jgi:hypothetical protein
MLAAAAAAAELGIHGDCRLDRATTRADRGSQVVGRQTGCWFVESG